MSEMTVDNRLREILSHNGKSFWFASFFLSKQSSRNAMILYAFCRMLDDWADSGGDAGLEKLAMIIDFFKSFASEDKSLADKFSSIQSYTQNEKELIGEFLKLELSMPILQELLKGLKKDTECVLVQEKSELIRYAYRVAGTVGLFMAQILGADSAKAGHHAIDLGIAMQLTNVCRDVLEDARLGRRYLPVCWTPNDIAQADDTAKQTIRDCVEQMLDLANKYYDSGIQGIYFLPKRSRFAVYLMAKIYRHIGVLILARGTTWWEGRVYVPIHRKVLLTLLALPRALRYLTKDKVFGSEKSSHNAVLHRALVGLPGINQ